MKNVIKKFVYVTVCVLLMGAEIISIWSQVGVVADVESELSQRVRAAMASVEEEETGQAAARSTRVSAEHRAPEAPKTDFSHKLTPTTELPDAAASVDTKPKPTKEQIISKQNKEEMAGNIIPKETWSTERARAASENSKFKQSLQGSEDTVTSKQSPDAARPDAEESVDAVLPVEQTVDAAHIEPESVDAAPRKPLTLKEARRAIQAKERELKALESEKNAMIYSSNERKDGAKFSELQTSILRVEDELEALQNSERAAIAKQHRTIRNRVGAGVVGTAAVAGTAISVVESNK